MTVAFERLADEPIVIVTFTNPLNAAKDTSAFNQAVYDHLQIVEDRLWVIAELSSVSISFMDGVFGLAEAAKGVNGAFKDPRVRIVLVGVGDMIKFLIKSAEQTQYGGVKGHVATSIEDAIDYCRRQGSASPP